MAKLKKNLPASWRAIQQNKLKRPVTSQSRFKQIKLFGKWLLTCGLLGLVALFGWGVWRGYQGVSDWMAVAGPMRTLQKVSFKTDGVLTRQWLESLWPFPWGQPLDQIDIFKLKYFLEAQGQVQTAVITREFPDRLGIVLKEACPVAKILLKNLNSKPLIYLLQSNGSLYQGYGYAKAVIEGLPYVEGIKLQRDKSGMFFPIIGFEKVALLLELARLQYPIIYQQIQSVNCSQMPSGAYDVAAILFVKLFSGLVIKFKYQDFESALERLAYILNYLEENHYQGGLKIDLTLEDQAIVEFSKNPAMVIPQKTIRR